MTSKVAKVDETVDYHCTDRGIAELSTYILGYTTVFKEVQARKFLQRLENQGITASFVDNNFVFSEKLDEGQKGILKLLRIEVASLLKNKGQPRGEGQNQENRDADSAGGVR